MKFMYNRESENNKYVRVKSRPTDSEFSIQWVGSIEDLGMDDWPVLTFVSVLARAKRVGTFKLFGKPQ